MEKPRVWSTRMIGEVGVEEIEMVLPHRRRSARRTASLYREGAALKELREESEKKIIEAAIAAHGGNKPEAARALGVERSHFYKKCRQLGVP